MRDICKLEDVIVERDKDIRMRTLLFQMHLQVSGEQVTAEGEIGYERANGVEWTASELDIIEEAFVQDAWFQGLRVAREIPDPEEEPTGN